MHLNKCHLAQQNEYQMDLNSQRKVCDYHQECQFEQTSFFHPVFYSVAVQYFEVHVQF